MTSTWYLAYFFLAAFDIITVCASLFLNHQIMQLYSDSVEANREWAVRMDQLAHLRQLAGAVNAPGNNVFKSHAVEQEAATMARTFQHFRSTLEAIKGDLRANVPPADLHTILKSLATVEKTVNDMKAEALQIFSYFAQNLPDLAGQHMATMDQKFAKVHDAFDRLDETIRDCLQSHFDRQKATAVHIQKFEYLIGLFIVGMVTGASLYGNQIYRQMKTDFTEKERFLKELEDKEERYRLLVEGVKDHANILLDTNGNISSWNTGAEHLFGFSAEDIIGQPYHQLLLIEEAPSFINSLQLNRAVELGTVEDEGWNLHKGGSRFWGEVVITALRDEQGRLRGFSNVTRNITERKQVQDALEEANRRLQDIDLLRTEFFANISHELRTPLTILQGEAEVTLRGRDKSVAEYKETLQRMLQLTDQVGKVVNDLLFLARYESGAIQFEKHTTRIADLLEQTLNATRTLAQKQSINLTSHGDDLSLTVHGDPQRLRQLFTIIVGNALNYTKEHGTVTITYSRNKNNVDVVIADTGIGIPPDSLNQVFNRFYRSPESKKMVPEGTGLGLPIAKWITEAHGGTITLSSQVGTGTSVTVCLPLFPFREGQ